LLRSRHRLVGPLTRWRASLPEACSARHYRERRRHGGRGNWGNPALRTFNVANEIANDFNLIGVIVRDFNVSELIFDQYQQFQTIKPVGSEIVTEVRFVSDATDVDVEMLGNKRANFAYFQAFLTRYVLSEAQASEDHDKPPESLSAQHSIKQSAPHCDAV
jgi:hypothetical protein